MKRFNHATDWRHCAQPPALLSLLAGVFGAVLVAHAAKPTPPPPPSVPTSPPARAWHSFAGNGGVDVPSSRLYLFGGSSAGWYALPGDLWYYRAHSDAWTLVVPSGTAKPGRRQWAALSCGNGACVTATGSNGVGLVNETWTYTEATNAWSKADCKRSPCPSPRQMATMAFDPSQRNHVLFGGRGSSAGFDDTLTFSTATKTWTLKRPSLKPAERNRAAAVYVPGVGLVLHGGQEYSAQKVFCDMFAWNGSNWAPVSFDAGRPHPCLHTHSIAWDGERLIVVGGYVNTSDRPSTTSWRFTFAADGRSGSWSEASTVTCQPIGGTDAAIHPGAQMAFDIPTATQVYFGGEENHHGGVVRYGNTVECY